MASAFAGAQHAAPFRETMGPYLSLVAPVFNEEACVEPFVHETVGVLRGWGRDFEILCVDDGSIDGTRDRLQRLAERAPELRVLELNGHFGQSAALLAGIRAARGFLV